MDIDVSSPDEYISSPDIQDIYTGLDSLTGADKDGETMTHTQESSDEEHWDESDEDYEVDQHADHNPQAKLFDRWWYFSLCFKLHMQFLTRQLIGYSHFFICLLCCIPCVVPLSFVL